MLQDGTFNCLPPPFASFAFHKEEVPRNVGSAYSTRTMSSVPWVDLRLVNTSSDEKLICIPAGM